MMSSSALSPKLAESPHAYYRDRLLSLSHDDSWRGIIDLVGQNTGQWLPQQAWRRTYGRLHPGREPYATLVFETEDAPQAICRMDLYEDRDRMDAEVARHVEVWQRLETRSTCDQSRAAVCIASESLGWILAMPFPCDAALLTLPQVMNQAQRPHVVRYRPDRRCTIREESAAGTRFGKIFANAEEGYQQYLDAVRLADAEQHGGLGFAVAPPSNWDEEHRCLWHRGLTGRPLDHDDFAVGGQSLARRLGSALASLANSTLKPHRVFGPVEQLQRTIHTADDLAYRVPALREELDRFVNELKRMHVALRPRPLRPIHGSPHAKQWLDMGERLGLVDFEKFCLGDPELDLGTFLAELDFEDPRQIEIPAIATAFIKGFEAAGGVVDAERLRAYRAHKQLVKALKSAQSLRIDGDHRAQRHLRRALQGLTG